MRPTIDSNVRARRGKELISSRKSEEERSMETAKRDAAMKKFSNESKARNVVSHFEADDGALVRVMKELGSLLSELEEVDESICSHEACTVVMLDEEEDAGLDTDIQPQKNVKEAKNPMNMAKIRSAISAEAEEALIMLCGPSSYGGYSPELFNRLVMQDDNDGRDKALKSKLKRREFFRRCAINASLAYRKTFMVDAEKRLDEDSAEESASSGDEDRSSGDEMKD